MNKLIVSLLLVFFLTLVLVFANAVQSNTIGHTNPTLSSVKPQRIVSMSPAITEILFALGVGDRVVGVTSYSDYPPEAKSKPSIGGYQAPDVETVVSLAPDIVFAMGEIQTKPIHILQQAGIPVLSIEPTNLQEVLLAIDQISAAIGEEERGSQLHAELATVLRKVQQRLTQAPSKRVFLEVWDKPLLTVGAKSFMNDIITQAGGQNVAASRAVDYTPCDIEALYAYNPESYLIISHNRNELHNLATQPEYADMEAVKSHQVFQLEDDLLARPGPRCFAGLVEVATVLHPEFMKSWEKE